MQTLKINIFALYLLYLLEQISWLSYIIRFYLKPCRYSKLDLEALLVTDPPRDNSNHLKNPPLFKAPTSYRRYF